MAQQQPTYDFGDIPDAGQAPTTPAKPDASGLNFGDIPDVSDKNRSFGLANLPPPTTKPAPEVVSRGPRGMRPAGAMGGFISALETGVNTVRSIGKSIDPRTSEGRWGLATGAASLGAAAATGGTSAVGQAAATAMRARGVIMPWIARILSPAAAGGLAEATEQVAGTKPVSPGAAGMAAASAGAYEVGGHAVMWPIRHLRTTFKAAPAVARQAGEKVKTSVKDARAVAIEATDEARERGRRLVTREEDLGKQVTRTTARAGATEVARTRSQAAAEVAAAEARGAEQVAQAKSVYDQLLADAPSVVEAGRKVRGVVQPRDVPGVPRGAAQRALDMAGAKVSEAAQTGPPIAVAPLKQALDQMASEARPTAIFGSAAGEVKGVGFLAKILQGKQAAAAGIKPGMPGYDTAVDQAKITSTIAKELGISENHPLPGLLGKIANMPDDVPLSFADAHTLKKLLDETVNFDQTAKKHVEQITKGLRSQLREAMSVHQPYNEATEAFARVVPLYRRGVGKTLIRAAQDDPDKVVRLLSAKDPARAQAIKDLVVGQSAAGGDPAAGQQAWQAIQSAWVYDNVIRGGPEKLSQRLATTLTEHPEFSRIVLGDETAQKVLSNLDTIGQAYQRATTEAADSILAAKTSGKALVASTKQQMGDRLTQAKDDAARRLKGVTEAAADTTRVTARAGAAKIEAARETVDKFRQSTVAPYGSPVSARLGTADLIRAAAFGPGTIAGGLSWARLLSGPRAADLVEWAAYSDRNTQRLVQALQSRLPDAGVAALMREAMAHVSGPRSSGPRPGDRAGSSPEAAAPRP